MHEFSIAQSLIELAGQHCPPGAIIREVFIEAGPIRGIDQEAMQFAWQCATPGTPCQNTKLELRILPWRLHCPACGAEWESDDVFVSCGCGHASPAPAGGDELRLTGLEVSTPEELAAEEAHARVGGAERPEDER